MLRPFGRSKETGVYCPGAGSWANRPEAGPRGDNGARRGRGISAAESWLLQGRLCRDGAASGCRRPPSGALRAQGQLCGSRVHRSISRPSVCLRGRCLSLPGCHAHPHALLSSPHTKPQTRVHTGHRDQGRTTLRVVWQEWICGPLGLRPPQKTSRSAPTPASLGTGTPRTKSKAAERGPRPNTRQQLPRVQSTLETPTDYLAHPAPGEGLPRSSIPGPRGHVPLEFSRG